MHYIKKDQVTNLVFYQVPKVLFTKKYENMTNNARILYAILRDRIDLSLKNNWFDEDGNVFILYSRDSLEKDAKLSQRTIIRIMKELNDLELIKEKRQGVNKPNIIYVCAPDDTENVTCQKVTSRSAKKSLQGMPKSHANDTEYNQTEYNETDNSLQLLSEVVWREDIEQYILSYLAIRSTYIKSKHKRVSNSNVELIGEAIDNLIDKQIELEEFKEQTYNYFEHLPKKNDGDIVCFLKASQQRLFGLANADTVQI